MTHTNRWIIGLTSSILLVLVYIFQSNKLAYHLGVTDKEIAFIVNKSIRFILNDALMIGVIFALFGKRQYVLFALLVQAAGVVFILLPYFILKLYFHSGNGPLVSFLHRLVLNPTLMLLLIPTLWIQHHKEHHDKR
jgi:exosortase F-associated protein